MPNTFLVSDTHFGHKGVCHFLTATGEPLRPWDTPEEMDEAMVDLWNKTVTPRDKVYHLGDVVINRKSLQIMERLNGDKVLIKGNHDIFQLNDYLKYFRDIRAYHVMNGLILSHIPVHETQLRRFGTNIHGHLHSGRIMKTVRNPKFTGAWMDSAPDTIEVIDPRYHCVCVEQTDFKPISFDDVQKRIEAEGGTLGFNNGNR